MTDKKKKMWALISSGLMIAFMLPSAVTSLSRNRELTAGYVGREKISVGQMNEARQQWALLKRLTVKQQNQQTGQEQDVNFAMFYLGSSLGPQGAQRAQE